MAANIWKDREIAFRSIEVSLIDISSTREWEGNLWIVGGEKFDVRGRYRLELDDGKSADIVLTCILGRKSVLVHFRVLAWKEKPRAVNSAAASP